jgi:hypothetical protein
MCSVAKKNTLAQRSVTLRSVLESAPNAHERQLFARRDARPRTQQQRIERHKTKRGQCDAARLRCANQPPSPTTSRRDPHLDKAQHERAGGARIGLHAQERERMPRVPRLQAAAPQEEARHEKRRQAREHG